MEKKVLTVLEIPLPSFNFGILSIPWSFLSYFFVKKIPLSRRVGLCLYGWMSEWVSERCMYVTPIRSGLLWTTNQIAACKGEPWVWRFHPDFRTAIFVFLQTGTGFLVLALFRRLLWLSPGLCGWVSKEFRIFDNQPRNQSLWHTLTCDQGFSFRITWNFEWNES